MECFNYLLSLKLFNTFRLRCRLIVKDVFLNGVTNKHQKSLNSQNGPTMHLLDILRCGMRWRKNHIWFLRRRPAKPSPSVENRNRICHQHLHAWQELFFFDHCENICPDLRIRTCNQIIGNEVRKLSSCFCYFTVKPFHRETPVTSSLP